MHIYINAYIYIYICIDGFLEYTNPYMYGFHIHIHIYMDSFCDKGQVNHCLHDNFFLTCTYIHMYIYICIYLYI